ncbi:MAG: site-2 protease family protein [Deltaproteobacteria bacterium]|nr:site-2 protease family protein [Deltaproteobacteria bacterium]
MMVAEYVQQICIWAVPVLVAIVFHEVAHGWVAYRLGDPTAARMGRLTLNPISHIDLFGTIIFPLLLILARAPFLFGYAKPVPVNFYNLRNPKKDMVWVALAGPATNLILAFLSYVMLKILFSLDFPRDGSFASSIVVPVIYMLQASASINIVLAVFNIFPIPPLDGGRVLVGLLPEPQSSAVARIEPYGFLIILVLLMSHLLDRVLFPLVSMVNLFFRLMVGLA